MGKLDLLRLFSSVVFRYFAYYLLGEYIIKQTSHSVSWYINPKTVTDHFFLSPVFFFFSWANKLIISQCTIFFYCKRPKGNLFLFFMLNFTLPIKDKVVQTLHNIWLELVNWLLAIIQQPITECATKGMPMWKRFPLATEKILKG